MLQPNRRKFRKEHKGRNEGLATRGTDSDELPLSFENSNDRGLTRYELKRVPDPR